MLWMVDGDGTRVCFGCFLLWLRVLAVLDVWLCRVCPAFLVLLACVLFWMVDGDETHVLDACVSCLCVCVRHWVGLEGGGKGEGGTEIGRVTRETCLQIVAMHSV